MNLNELLRKAGLEALEKQPQIKLVAQANKLFHFASWASKFVDDGIVGALNLDSHEHCEWINNYCRETKLRNVNDFSYHHPFVESIIKEVWEKFQPSNLEKKHKSKRTS
jgi:hypothetical protein